MGKNVRLVSWNVNGIRACAQKGLRDVIQNFDADLFCLQETKAHQEQVEIASILPEPGRYGQTWASAEKKGYSGTSIFSSNIKYELSSGIGFEAYDREGRGTIAQHKDFSLINLYFPNGAASEDRHYFKMGFLKEILRYFKAQEKNWGPLVICGDYNIAHKEVDIHDPKSNQQSSGFLPEEREWMDDLERAGFVDTFRLLHPDQKDAYSWWSFRQRSRERNKGWRLDYFFVSESLADRVRSAEIHPTILGSDHCPVSLELEF